jgi:tRNA(fMet)-specific endonuclease VapC
VSPRLLDTDILSEFLKRKNVSVLAHAVAYLRQHRRFTFSAITRYEILRGLEAKKATIQLARFHRFSKKSTILAISDDILVRAAKLWAHGQSIGRTPRDADLIIAATAQAHQMTLATGNTRDFSWIPGLMIEDWKKP